MKPDGPLAQDDRHGAVFSEDRTYRYRLRRTWNAELPTLAFVLLNPSTADETTDDPTVRRCLGYAKDWGYGTLLVGNLFALRSTDPDHLYGHPGPVGPENDKHLAEIGNDADLVVVAWGHHGDHLDRGPAVARDLAEIHDYTLAALGTTKAGHPVHPLYQPKDAEIVSFSYPEGEA